MIYLRHRYNQSNLSEPEVVMIDTERVDWLMLQVRSEFETLFPSSEIVLNPTSIDNVPVDLMVLAYREATANAGAVLEWGWDRWRRVSLGLGFYCLEPRRFEVVDARAFRRWAWRQKLLAWTVKGFRRFPGIWRLVEKGGLVCGF